MGGEEKEKEKEKEMEKGLELEKHSDTRVGGGFGARTSESGPGHRTSASDIAHESQQRKWEIPLGCATVVSAWGRIERHCQGLGARGARLGGTITSCCIAASSPRLPSLHGLVSASRKGTWIFTSVPSFDPGTSR